MNVLVSASARFVVTADGHLWSGNNSLGHAFWARYLDAFEEVFLMVRAVPRMAPPRGWNRATGVGVRGLAVPDFQSVGQILRVYPSLRRQIDRSLSACEVVILRVPCPLAEFVWRSLGSARPYGVEVVGDPAGTFSRGSVSHSLRPFFRSWFRRQLRRQCAGASASSYVTEKDLQSKYPSAPDAFSTHYSSIELSDTFFRHTPRFPRTDRRLRLVSVGTLARLYKATDVLIDASAACARDGLDLELAVVGDGRYRTALQFREAAVSLGDRISFAGQLTTREAVFNELDRADVFVLPSRHEGLPKAMIEAMARGLPCIGSTVGGIPELLSPEDLVPPNDVGALAAKIREVIGDRERLARMSARNLIKAREYRSDLLRARRVEFYRYLKERTEEWVSSRKAASAVRVMHECSEKEAT